MKRETGYYHVKRTPDSEGNTEWEIAYYEVLGDRNVWTLMWFNDLEFQDDAFCEINETRIKSPDEKTPGLELEEQTFKEVNEFLTNGYRMQSVDYSHHDITPAVQFKITLLPGGYFKK